MAEGEEAAGYKADPDQRRQPKSMPGEGFWGTLLAGFGFHGIIIKEFIRKRMPSQHLSV
jgi:hypothetical protein